MIKYQKEYNQYFVDFFRNSTKYQNRKHIPKIRQKRKISVVTTCMNRLQDLQKTLPKNLEDSKDYPVEFVLLDYDSKDGLENWVKKDLIKFIIEKKLVYYKALNQNFFKPNHSRNLSFRLATSEIITNLDSDNYLHSNFLETINTCCDYNVITVAESFMSPYSNRLNLRGRFAFMKKDIYKLGGFDEDLDKGYSHDDTSFICRAILNGFKIARFKDNFLEDRIETIIENRCKFMENKDYIDSQNKNIQIITDKLFRCDIIANKNRGWGEATVIKNFSDVIVLKDAPSIL